MTTETTAIQASKQGLWALIGATTVTVALLGGAAFWQLRPSGEATSPRTTSAPAGTMETVGSMGGLAGPRGARAQGAGPVTQGVQPALPQTATTTPAGSVWRAIPPAAQVPHGSPWSHAPEPVG